MARVQTQQYQGRGEQTQSVSAPTIQAIQARFDPNDSGAFQLAKAVGALDTEGLSRQIASVSAMKTADERKAAEAYANGITVDELGKRIKDGSLLPSQSPAFNAALQHIYGENSQAGFQRDTLAKMESGELKFDSEQEMDEYLTKNRNDTLEGQSKFTISGFDKGYSGFRQKALDMNSKILNSQAEEAGVQNAGDNLKNMLTQVTAPDFKGNAADELMKRYELLSSSGVGLLRADARREALSGLLTNIAASGNKELATELLSRKLPNNGPSLRAFLGDAKAQGFINGAESVYAGVQRKRVDRELLEPRMAANEGRLNEESLLDYTNKNSDYMAEGTAASLIAHNRAVQAQQQRALELHQKELLKARGADNAASYADMAIAQGRVLQDYTGPDGKVYKADEIGQAAIQRRIEASPDMQPVEVFKMYSNANVKSPEVQRRLEGATFNIGQVTMDEKGKPLGELSQETIAALDEFALARSVSEQWTQDMTGGSDKYKTLLEIQALRENGVPDPAMAAALVNQKNRRNIAPALFGKFQSEVDSAVSDLVEAPFFSKRNFSEILSGEFGSADKNILPIANAVRSLATTYMSAGITSNGAEAVQKAREYFEQGNVTTQINNTLYLTKDLPRVPEGENTAEWMKTFTETKVAEKLTALGIPYNKDEVGLIPQEGGSAPLQVYLNKIPIKMYFAKKEIEGWVAGELDKRVSAYVEQRNQARTANPNAGRIPTIPAMAVPTKR